MTELTRRPAAVAYDRVAGIYDLYTAPMEALGGRRVLQARAQVIHRGRRLAVATAQLVTADGRAAALADASVMLRPGQPWTEPFALADEQLPHADPTAHCPALAACGCHTGSMQEPPSAGLNPDRQTGCRD